MFLLHYGSKGYTQYNRTTQSLNFVAVILSFREGGSFLYNIGLTRMIIFQTLAWQERSDRWGKTKKEVKHWHLNFNSTGLPWLTLHFQTAYRCNTNVDR